MENREDKKQQAWETFISGGKIEDYLAYKKGEAYGNDKNKGDSGFGNKPW